MGGNQLQLQRQRWHLEEAQLDSENIYGTRSLAEALGHL